MKCRKCGGNMLLYWDWGLRWMCNECGHIINALEDEAEIVSLNPQEDCGFNDPPEELREEESV